MKRTLAALLALIMVFSMLPVGAIAEDHDACTAGEPVTVQEPTCTEKGAYVVNCTVCGKELESGEIDALGHTPSEADEYDDVDPTCEKDGHHIVHCKVCGEEIVNDTIPATGHDYQTVAAKAPTCTEAGWEEYAACTVCDKEQPGHEKVDLPALGHGEGVPATDPTHNCDEADEDGNVSVDAICPVCGEILKDKINVKVEHTWKEMPAEASTCVEHGHTAYQVCEICGKIEGYEELELVAHKYKWVGALAGDCTHDGRLAGYVCQVCGELHPDYPATVIPAAGHKSVKIPAVAATCESTGLTAGEKCSVCGEILIEQQVTPALGHNWKSIMGTKATCTEDGEGAHRVCLRCGIKEYVDPDAAIIPAHGHSNEDGYWPEGDEYGDKANTERKVEDQDIDATYITEEELAKAKPATCTEDGYQPEERCVFCDEVLIPGKVLPATGHDWELIADGIFPTCTDDGISDLFECKVCGIQQGGEPINKLGHNFVLVEAELPTCEEKGHFAYYKCDREDCDYAYGEFQEIDLISLEGNVLTTYVLSEKDVIIETEMPEEGHPEAFEIDAVDHEFREEIKPLDPTCTDNGIEAGATRCVLCNKTFDVKVIPATGHTLVQVDGYEAECTETGLETYTYCDVCGKAALGEIDEFAVNESEDEGKKLSESDVTMPEDGTDPAEFVIAALGHDEKPGATKEPTCLEDGYTGGIYCDRCGLTIEEQEVLKALGHDMVEVEAKIEPTCTEAGKEAVLKCSRCDHEEGGEEIPALGHDAGTATKKIPATCTSYGLTAGVHCTRCETDYEGLIQHLVELNGKYDAEEVLNDGWIIVPKLIDPIPHDLEHFDDADVTCEEPGYKDYAECKNCDYTEGEKTEPLGHKWLKVPGGEQTAPTCTEAGTDGLQQCARCGLTEVKVVPALGHTAVKHAKVEATCAAPGCTEYTDCAVCGAILDGQKTEIPQHETHDDLQHVDEVMATCKTPGHSAGQVCTVCGFDSCTELAPDADAYHEFLSTEDELEKLEWITTAPGDGTPGSGMQVKMCPECGYILAVRLYPEVLKGDVNMDGRVNSLDALMILQFKAGVIDTLPNMVAADYNEDESINSLDALGILNSMI